MAMQKLSLPNYVEPPPQIPVDKRFAGSMLDVMRRHAGYRFVAENDRYDGTSAWLERAAPCFE